MAVRALLVLAVIGGLWGICAGCDRGVANEVVLYCSVDEPYARPIVEEFTKETGIPVRLVTDTEATKSVGLAEKIRAEANKPVADVFWNNEPFRTIALTNEGLLVPYESAASGGIDRQFCDDKHHWASVGLRVRVMAVAPQVSMYPDELRSIEGMTDPKFKGRIAMARPIAGTTASHIAALRIVWGEEKWVAFLRGLRENDVKLLGGNSDVAEAVARGTMSFGLTDNDDVHSMRRQNYAIGHALLDQNGMGTLVLPTTVGLVKGSRNPENAKKLIDHILSERTERRLIEMGFASASVRNGDKTVAMKVDYAEVARQLPEATRRANAILEGRE
jgi:iron(III) transport system substrate-binding protein